MDGVAAFVLAGGGSSRMGKDKAFLELGEETLLERAIRRASTVGEVRIVGDMQRFLPYGRVVEDLYSGCGPLAGIHAALKQNLAPLNLVLAVDLPFVDGRFLSYLAASASQCAALVTVPCIAGGWQPLCAVYRTDFAPAAEQALQRRRNRVDSLFQEVETRVIGDEEFSRMGFSPDIFLNVNTPEQYEKARLRVESQFRDRGEHRTF